MKESNMITEGKYNYKGEGNMIIEGKYNYKEEDYGN